MRTRSRITLIAAAGAAAALSLGAITPALADTTPKQHPHSVAATTAVTGDPRAAVTRVADFYGAYIDSIWDIEDPAASANATALRAFYLSPAEQRRVAAFEAKEHADGVLFAQNVPVKWNVRYTGSGAGHATALVTLTWSDGADPEVSTIKVQTDLRTRKITDLRPAD
ncbi:hypothetical protein ACGFS9_08630 [Streptomyces sp. NPDC048566]|uniref:hypothetical protein n=1 Tax=Streptomyces sp. NPDC048566 TaxID=3365569 RepID=UPI003721AF4A